MKPIVRMALGLFLQGLLLLTMGCTIGSDGWGAVTYPSGPGGGYQGPPSGLPRGSLGCEITYPKDHASFDWEQTIWVYGVIWREGYLMDAYPWEGPQWEVDLGKIGESYYMYDQLSPEVWVRFPFNGRVFGPGRHDIALTAWDARYSDPFPVTDTISVILD